MSSNSKEIIVKFIKLLNSKPSIFSKHQLEDLANKIDLLPDDIKEISKCISVWLMPSLEKLDAQASPEDTKEKVIPDKSDKHREPPKLDDKINKEIVQNEIKKATEEKSSDDTGNNKSSKY